MATTVEAHPPMMEDFPSPTDEGLSSPDSEDYPRKQNHIYNDSGILMDDSAMNSTLGGTTNGHLDDLSDTSSMSDPSDYHINRDDHFPAENDISCGYDTQRTADDSAVYTNGDITEIDEDTIQVTETRREARIPFENLLPPTDDNYVPVLDKVTPYESDRDSLSDSEVMAASVRTATPTAPPEADLDEVQEEVILRSEVKRDELQERMIEEERERERVDFVPGAPCTDVETALRILKTRYRLSCSTLKKCIITSAPPVDVRTKRYSAPVFSYDRSRWNLEDMIRGPNEQMPWWSKTREPESITVEKDNRTTMNDTIDRRQGEIADLLQKVLDEERRKQGEINKNQPEPVVVSEPPQVCSQEPQLETLPEPAEEPPVPDQSEPNKKKKGNIFQRMIRAVRKRLSRNRHRA